MAAFLLNPYDGNLDLSDKGDRKLYADACKGLPESNRFDGKRENYKNFVKLIEKDFKKTRVMEVLEIGVEWDSDAQTPEGKRTLKEGGSVNIFQSNRATRDQVVSHCDRVWSNSAYGDDTPTYYRRFKTTPTDSNELEKERNRTRLKHVMMGSKLWDSFTPEFKIEIMGNREEFERGEETDGPLLWDFVRRRINPSTTVGASRLKDEIETKTLDDFDHDVVKFNSWFCDTRDLIIREEGDKYDEYLRSLFRAYQVSNQEELRETIAAQKRKWVHGEVKPGYHFRDLMEVARVTYNNMVEDRSWNVPKKKGGTSDERNYLALATQILQKVESVCESHSGNGRNRNGDGFPQYAPWRFENPEGLDEKVIKGKTMKWCHSDCHPKPMWCGRKVCLNKADYLASKNKKGNPKKGGDNGENKVGQKFKLALAALTSDEDFAKLEEEFFSSSKE